ncbi:MAG: VOC family protein [Myxococcales bacterium]|nr:VOC family protein [Myxococcales bacterium]
MNQHRFVWHDLGTTDVEGAKRFYGEVFHWRFDGEPDYLHITAGDRMIGGIRPLGKDEHQPPSWLGYVLVDDVAATVATIEKQRGRVYVPTTVMENVGTFAVTADPTGGVFAPWRSARPEENKPDSGQAAVPATGTFCWDELMTTDPAAAGAFYAEVLGWKPHAVDMGGGMIYTLFQRPGTTGFDGNPVGAGGMMKSPPEVPHSYWLAYVAVESADRSSEQAAKLGATVMVPPTDIPNVGRFACWTDPQGAALGVLAAAPMK